MGLLRHEPSRDGVGGVLAEDGALGLEACMQELLHQVVPAGRGKTFPHTDAHNTQTKPNGGNNSLANTANTH